MLALRPDLSQWLALRASGLLDTIFEDPRAQLLDPDFKACWMKATDSWAYRWTFTCLANGGLTALPNRNLVNNVGFGEDATHTTGGEIDTAICAGIDSNQHPSFVLRDSGADRYTYDHVFGGKWNRFPLSLIRLPKRAAVVAVRTVKKTFLDSL